MAFPNPLSLSTRPDSPSTTRPTPGSVSHQLLHLGAKSSFPSVIGSRCSSHPVSLVLAETSPLPALNLSEPTFPFSCRKIVGLCSLDAPRSCPLLLCSSIPVHELAVLEKTELDLPVQRCCCSLLCFSIVLFRSPLHKGFPFSFCSSFRPMLLA